MGAGRPLKFESVEALEAEIEAYFKSCWEEVWKERRVMIPDGQSDKLIPVKDARGEFEMEWYQLFDREGNPLLRMKTPYTITGLAVALNTSRQTLLNYEERPEFFDTIKKAKDICENFLEEGMFTGAIPAVPGIFNAKNNYGWVDRTEQNVSATVTEMPSIKRDGKEIHFDIGASKTPGSSSETAGNS